MIRLLRRAYSARRRKIDLDILWPSVRNRARDLDHAKAAFAVHARADDAWKFLSESEIQRVIEGLF